MKIVIEVPKVEDFNRVNELAKQVHEIHINWRPDLFLKVDEIIDKDEFKARIESKGIFVAKIEEEIVGYITMSIKEKANPSMRYMKQLQIEALCVDEKYRSKGIGTDILNNIKQYAKENECTDLYITVNEENIGAIKLYEKFGFKVKNIVYSMQI